MKKRIHKVGVIIAVATLISINIGLLTSKSDSVLTLNVKAQEVNSQYLKYHFLKDVWCVSFDVSFDVQVVEKWYGLGIQIEAEGELDMNASKKKCKEITQEIYCNVYETTSCASGGVSDDPV